MEYKTNSKNIVNYDDISTDQVSIENIESKQINDYKYQMVNIKYKSQKFTLQAPEVSINYGIYMKTNTDKPNQKAQPRCIINLENENKEHKKFEETINNIRDELVSQIHTKNLMKGKTLSQIKEKTPMMLKYIKNEQGNIVPDSDFVMPCHVIGYCKIINPVNDEAIPYHDKKILNKKLKGIPVFVIERVHLGNDYNIIISLESFTLTDVPKEVSKNIIQMDLTKNIRILNKDKLEELEKYMNEI